ncbi:hypothetical protein [Piscirickettsia salmonis]|uniref:hypothetical protein n=1 Tax=Piscirickettsia salmonis TaxID=1238 RepID=UPI003A7F9157
MARSESNSQSGWFFRGFDKKDAENEKYFSYSNNDDQKKPMLMFHKYLEITRLHEQSSLEH